MTTTAIAAHTVGIEPITDDTRPHAPADATRAVVERYDGRLVKVIITDADHLMATLDAYGRSAAHAYGADYIETTPAADADIAAVLRRTARHVAQPINASLRDAVRTATRDPHLAEQAIQQLADTLRLHPRDLPLWDVTRTRNDVAAVLHLAARRTR